MGRPCFFVRLSGCNLKCSWCDTSYAWTGGSHVSCEDLISSWCQSGLNLVQFTGGEPLLQSNIYPVMQRFISLGAEVLLESNGSLSTANVPEEVQKILDRKTPSSGMVEAWSEDNAAELTSGDQLKFVISDRRDYMWALKEIERLNLHSEVSLLFSPASNILKPVELAEWILSDGVDVRMQIQLHKILWGDKRGV